jgi:magnesium transporter
MARSDRAVRALLERYLDKFPDEAARAMEHLSLRDVVALLASHSAPLAGRALQQLTPDLAADVLGALEPDAFRGLLAMLEPVRAASLLARLDPEQRAERLDLLDGAQAKEIRDLMHYRPETAGAVMDARIVTFRADATVKEALTKLRAQRGRPVADVFVVGDDGRLAGALPLQDLAVAEPSVRIESLRLRVPVSVQATTSREEVVEVFERGIGTTIPVVDFEDRPVGVIRNDVLVAAAQQEATADLQKMVGGSTEERALSPASFAVRKRLPWLYINLATAFLASSVVALFQGTIARYTALAVLMPVVAGQSGNTGMQALAVTLRGLALREIRMRHWLRVGAKELLAGAVNGIAVAVLTALGVYLWSHSPGMALVIGVSMVGSMVIASIAGASVPMVLTALRQDPAQASSVILTTVTDCGGFFSFLGLATLLSKLL